MAPDEPTRRRELIYRVHAQIDPLGGEESGVFHPVHPGGDRLGDAPLACACAVTGSPQPWAASTRPQLDRAVLRLVHAEVRRHQPTGRHNLACGRPLDLGRYTYARVIRGSGAMRLLTATQDDGLGADSRL